jgi:PAS domain S-box-containing protein
MRAPKQWREHSRRPGYAVAVAATAVAAAVRWAFDPWLGFELPYITFFIAIIATGWVGGARAALLAALLSFVVSLYLFVPPRFSFGPPHGAFLFGVVLYWLTAAVMVAIIGAMHRARRQAQEQQQMWLTTLSSIGDAVVATDAVGRVTFMNPVAGQLTGWSGDEAAGRPLFAVLSLLHEQTRAPLPDPVALVVRHGQADAPDERALLLTRDGRELAIEDKAAPIRGADGEVRGAVLVFRDVTARRMAEQQRVRAQELVLSTLESIPDAFVRLSPDWRITWVNQQYERRSGRPRAAQLGKLWWDEWPVLAGSECDARLRHAMASREAEEFETDCPLWHSWLAVKACPTGGGELALFIQDVTARHQAEASLRASEERFRLAADAVSGIIYDLDLKSGRVERSQGLFEVLGYHPHEVDPTADWWWWQVHPDDRHELERKRDPERGFALERGVYLYRVRHKDGHYVWLSDRSVGVRDAQGRMVRQVGCSIDISALKDAEDRLRDADRRKDEFLATLAHELRNPLAPISNAVQFLKATVHEPKAAWGLGVVERQVQTMARLLDDLLDVSRISRNKLVLRREQVELGAVLRQAVETSRPLIDMGGHALSVALPPEPVLLDADPVRLAQVFSNLLTNAAKYTPGGGHIDVSAARSGDEVAVSVRDDGIGIAPDMLPRLFEIFSQAEPALARAQGGLGIGLSLVRGLVELHGGRIEAHSAGTGHGSQFVVTLPVHAHGAPAAVAAPRAAAPAHCRVLVADDNRDGADSLRAALEAMGHEVCVAYDGERAVALALEKRPDVMLVDIGMPRKNGYEVCGEIRRQPWGPAVLMVALTGWGQDEDRRRAAEAGFDHHLVKPADLARLSELLALARLRQP